MTYGTIRDKHVTYAACGRCGRIYCTGDHRSCPECHGHRKAVATGYVPGFELEEEPVPVRRMPR